MVAVSRSTGVELDGKGPIVYTLKTLSVCKFEMYRLHVGLGVWLHNKPLTTPPPTTHPTDHTPNDSDSYFILQLKVMISPLDPYRKYKVLVSVYVAMVTIIQQ